MPEFNIKISELNIVSPQPPFTEDFFPLVHSASMTTYRTTIQDIGSLMTHSIYADTSSYSFGAVSASHANYADSASYAISSSHAISASHALIADSASFYPPVDTVISCSWASRSLQSWYSTRSLDVDTHGVPYHFPFWTSDTPGAGNGNLVQDSMIFYYPRYSNTLGLVSLDSASTNLGLYTPAPNHRPDYQISRFNDRANVGWGFAGNVGLQTAWPIISHMFNGTDQRDWYFTSSATPHVGFDPDLQITNSYFSGSAGDASSGSFYTIPVTDGSIASIFNGKWIRIVSNGGNPGGNDSIPSSHVVADHASMGEMWSSADQTMKGLVSVELSTAESNSWSKIDFWVHGTPWGGNQSVTILHIHSYGFQHIRAIRVSTKPGGVTDPPESIDILVDGLFKPGDFGTHGDTYLGFKAQSWQGIRFLKWLNVDPWAFVNTGSNDITQDGTQLICPAAPGFYSNTPKAINYNIHGRNVVIWPNSNEITQSGAGNPSLISSHSLHVSGTINTNTHFSCDNHPGLFTTVTYGTNNLYFSGGILVGKFPPDTFVPPVVTNCNGQGTFTGGNSMPSEQTWTLGSGTGVVTVHFFTYTVPDRLQVIFDTNVVLNSGYRGTNTPTNQTNLNNALATYGSASEYIVGGPQYTASFFKNSATTTAKVQVFGPIGGTAWNYWISCPGQPIS